MSSSLEIRCSACKRLTLARAEAVYEDFKKVAETFVCSACGHRYPSREKTPFVDANGQPRVFSDADKPAAVAVFKSDERRRSCAWCRHFIVNPFRQRCGINNREVEATDVCARFLAKADPAATAAKVSGSDASRRFEALFGNETPAAPVENPLKAAPVIPPLPPKAVEPTPAPTPVPVPVPVPTPVPVPVPEPAPVSVAEPVPVKPAPKKAAAKKRAVAPADAAPAKTPAKKAPAKKRAVAPAASTPPEAPAKKPVGRPRKTKTA